MFLEAWVEDEVAVVSTPSAVPSAETVVVTAAEAAVGAATTPGVVITLVDVGVVVAEDQGHGLVVQLHSTAPSMIRGPAIDILGVGVITDTMTTSPIVR